MPVTIKQIAAELGVSPAVVSLALNGSPLVAVKTRDRVLALAKRLDYVPNNFGRGLQSRRSHLLGYMLTGITASFFNEILQGAGLAAADANYGLLTGWIKDSDQEQLEHQLQIMLEKNIDGLILSIREPLFRPFVAKLKQRKIPFVFCSTYFGDEYPLVITDNFRGGYLAADHLLRSGHRRLLCCDSDSHRLAGNLAAAQAYPDACAFTFSDPIQVPTLLREKNATAVVAYADLQAADIIDILRKDRIRVPEDVSLVGFDDIWLAARPEFGLTTVAQQKTQLGAEAVNALLAMIGGDSAHARILLEPHLVERRTVARR